MGQIDVPVFMQAFILEFPDEAFGQGIIRKLSRPDVFNDAISRCQILNI
jgi:hypothetical protein